MYGGNIIKVVTLVILESSAPAEEVMLHYGYSFRCINLQGSGSWKIAVRKYELRSPEARNSEPSVLRT